MGSTVIPTVPEVDDSTKQSLIVDLIAAISDLDSRISTVETGGGGLSNSSFEVVDGEGEISSWTATVSAGASVARSSTFACEGTYSMKMHISGTSGSAEVVSSPVAVRAGSIMMAGACFMLDTADQPTTFKIYVKFYQDEALTQLISTITAYEANADAIPDQFAAQVALPGGDSSTDFESRYSCVKVPTHANWATLTFYLADTESQYPELYVDAARLTTLDTYPERAGGTTDDAAGTYTVTASQTAVVLPLVGYESGVGADMAFLDPGGRWYNNGVDTYHGWLDGAPYDMGTAMISAGIVYIPR